MSQRKFYFLCGNFDKINFIYAIKTENSVWHYFEEPDSVISVHNSLSANLEDKICRLNKVQSIGVNLTVDQQANYVRNEKFVFKGKELKTCKRAADTFEIVFI